MTVDYTEMAEFATELITEYGASATMYKKSFSGPEYDRTIVWTDYSVIAVKVEGREWNKETGSVIRKTQLYITSGSEKPTLGDRIEFGGIKYTFSGVEVIAPNGVDVVAYIVDVSTT